MFVYNHKNKISLKAAVDFTRS